MNMSAVVFRQLYDLRSGTYTYLLADSVTRQAVLIDPVFEQANRDSALLRELDLRLLYTLDTHVHADHITGAWMLKRQTGSLIALAAAANAEEADLPLEHGDTVAFGTRHLSVRATPGHTNSCLTYVLDDESMAFTGDALQPGDEARVGIAGQAARIGIMGTSVAFGFSGEMFNVAAEIYAYSL